MKTLLALSAVVLASLTLGAAAAQAASLQPVGSFVQPIYVTSDPGNPDRLFVVERQGTIEEVQNETVRMFADLSSVVEAEASERGLLSIALAPSFDTTGLLYVDYTGREEPGEIHVAELRAFGGNAPVSTLRNLLTIPHPGPSNHNGGQLQFGPEGDLYVSTGDGGGSNDELHNAQNLTSLLGKILRIDPRPLGLLPYTAPAGNPFPAATPPNDTIWSYGLRNPFRFSFDLLTGAIVIGDVGQAKREEVDYAAPGLGGGADYGWNCREGRIVGPATDPQCATPPPGGFVEPVFDYPHIDPGGGAAHGCAIVGGYIVRDQSLGSLYGRYLYGDLCTGELRSLSFSNPFTSDRFEGLHVDNLNSFGEDSCGRLYTVSGDGVVARLVGPTPAVCRPVSQVSSTRRPALVGLRAVRRRVERHRRALLTAWASPCEGRRGERVKLRRGRTVIASKPLSRACTAHFSPRIGRPTAFRATIAEDKTYLAAISRRLMIKIQRRHRR